MDHSFSRPSHLVAAAGVSFFIFLIPCIFILPFIFRQDLGISNYGVSPLTVVPFTLGFLTSIGFIVSAAYLLQKGSDRQQHVASASLYTIALLQLGVLVIPDSHIDNIRYTHIAVGMALFAAEFAFASYITYVSRARSINWILLGLQALAGLSAFLSLGHILEYEAQSQLAFQLAFILVSVTGLRACEQRHRH